MRLVSVRDAYLKAQEWFKDLEGPEMIVAPLNGDLDLLRQLITTSGRKKLPKGIASIELKNTLFMGDVLEFGPKSKDAIMKGFVQQGLRTIRGRQESTLLSVLDAAEGKKTEKLAAMVSIWCRSGAAQLLASFLEDRKMADLTDGKVIDHREMLQAARAGNMDPEVFGQAVKAVLGDDLINWVRSLPPMLLFPSSLETKKCGSVVCLTHGNLDPDLIKDIRMLTDENAVWSDSTSKSFVNSGEILYAMFREQLDPDCVHRVSPTYFDHKTSTIKKVSGYHALSSPGTMTKVILMGRMSFPRGMVVAVKPTWKNMDQGAQYILSTCKDREAIL